MNKFTSLILAFLLAACNFHFVPTATPLPTATPQPPARLSVTYLQNGTLFLWREGDAAPRSIATNANQPVVLAPDGQHVAFTRGQEGQPQTLWVVSAEGTLQQEVVELGDIPAQRSARAMIRSIEWLDEATIYFNSFQSYEWGYQPDNNLYRVEIGTETQPASSPRLILPPGAGGQFAFSPNRQYIAVVYPGQYDTEDGRVLILDPLGERALTALEFTAVSTASEIPYYPMLHWLPDSSAVRVPIPDRDLVYDEATAPPVQLWRLPVDGDAQIMGYVPASFQGLPRWSDRTGAMLYSQYRVVPDMYDLYLADSDGGAAQSVADGNIEIVDVQWLSGQDRFVFQRGTTLMLGQRGTPLQALVENVQQWWLADDTVLYTRTAAGVIELAYLRIGESPIRITTITEPLSVDAVVAS